MKKTNLTFAYFRKFLFLTGFSLYFTGLQIAGAQCDPVTAIAFTASCDGSATLTFAAGAGNADWNIDIDENGVPFAFITNASTTIINIAGVSVSATYDIAITSLCGGMATAAANATIMLAPPIDSTYVVSVDAIIPPSCTGLADGSITFTINDPTDVACTSAYTYSGTAGGVAYGPVAAGMVTVKGVSAGGTTITSFITAPATCGICTVQNPAFPNLLVPNGTDDAATFDVLESFGANMMVIQDAVNVANTTFNLAGVNCVIDLLYNLTDITDDACGGGTPNLSITNTTAGKAVLATGPDALGDYQFELGDLGPGIYTISVAYTDNGGNTTTQTFDVTIKDATGPILNTGGGATLTLPICATTIALPDFAGNATDCSGINSVTQVPVSGTLVGAGTTSVTVTAMDGATPANTTTQIFNVTVVPSTNAPPELITPGNLAVQIADCQTTVVVNYDVQATDDCINPITPTLVSGPASGSTLAAGNHVVTWTVTDGVNAPVQKSFTIRVDADVDAPPVVDLTGNSQISIPPCETTVTVNYNLNVSDDCDNPVNISLANVSWPGANPIDSASVVVLAPNEISFSIEVAVSDFDKQLRATYTDGAGNASSDDIFVTILVPPPPAGLACNDLINVGVHQSGCRTLITPDMVLEGGDGGCLDAFIVTILDDNSTVDDNYLDGAGTFIYTVTSPNGFSCWGQIRGEDKLSPVINCLDATINCIDDAVPPLVPFPTATDNCDPNPTIQLVSETFTDNICAAGGTGTATIVRKYVASDASGNTSTECTQTITINRTTPVFPPDVTLDCATNPNVDDLNLAGNLANVQGVSADCKFQYNHSDLILPSCGTTFKVIRTWTVLDWCTSAILSDKQIISVADNLPPDIIPPPVIAVSANIPGTAEQNCSSQGFIPPATISDNCSDWTVRIFTPAGEVIYANGVDGKNGGNIPPPGLGFGVHAITYSATDACGNVSTKTASLSVIDDVAPTVICDAHTQVALDENGFAEVAAEVFDDGSFDNCCIDSFLVRRMDENCGLAANSLFGESVTFCCADVLQPSVTVVFRVKDCEGNTNDCMATVFVEDKFPPVATDCPADLTIDCDFYVENLETGLALSNFNLLNQFGNAAFDDNCQVVFNQVSVDVNINSCKEGTIKRTWIVSDPANNAQATCMQTIFVQHVSDWVVEFPDDTLLSCGVDPNSIFDFIGEPIIFNETCELIAVSYEDALFNVVENACFKLVRQWTVINWCNVGFEIQDETVESSEAAIAHWLNGCDPSDEIPTCLIPFRAEADLQGDGDHTPEAGDSINNDQRTFQDGLNIGNFDASKPLKGAQPDGFITYQQVIKVIDDVKPIFAEGCNIPDVCIEDNTCGATINLPVPAIDDCVGQENVSFKVESDLGNGFGPFSNVAPGTYQVRYTATDNCGNSNSCETTFSVADCKKPTPLCIGSLVVDLMEVGQDNDANPNAGMVDVWASDFDAGSFDNCPGDLQFSFSEDVSDVHLTFNCFNIGIQTVTLWVTDAAGNKDFCEVNIDVQDNQGACMGNPLIAGAVATEEGAAIEEVSVNLNGNGQASYLTAQDGSFHFENLPPGQDFTITPQKDDDYSNGLTTFDLVLISKHILGTLPLDSPYKIIAADVNHSNSVSTLDLVELRRLVLQISSEFSNNTSWRFVDANFVFPNPADPFATPFPEVINFNNLTQDELEANFVAVKIGDVNGSAVSNSNFLAADDRQGLGTLKLWVDDMQLKAGQEVQVDFHAENFSLAGFQFSLDFEENQLEFLELVEGLAQKDNFGFTFVNEGAITASWNGNETQNEENELLFGLKFRAKTNSKLSDLLAVNSRIIKAEAYDKDLRSMDVQLDFNVPEGEFELFQNTPNPFQTNTLIAFKLPEAAAGTLSILDVSGRILKVVKGQFSKGFNEIQIERKDLTGKGVFYYQLQMDTFSATKKMIVLD